MDIDDISKHIIKCDECKKEFIKTQGQQRFCSRICYRHWHWARDPRRAPKKELIGRDLFAA
jgi:hypothetical protein